MRICCLGGWGNERNLSYLSDWAVSTTDEGWLRSFEPSFIRLAIGHMQLAGS